MVVTLLLFPSRPDARILGPTIWNSEFGRYVYFPSKGTGFQRKYADRDLYDVHDQHRAYIPRDQCGLRST